jgi:DnaJ-domain-containing protein 1
MVTIRKDGASSGSENGTNKRLEKILELINWQESRMDLIEQEV